MMTPERWRQIERVLQAALERTPAERSALLDRECAEDANLRAEVESLLASEPETDGFLEAHAYMDAAPLFSDANCNALSGRQFGHYFITTQLGSGGMGEVYLAVDAKLGRKVALKLLDPIFAEETQWRTRFLREARLASSLDHQNICTIHEIGEAEGRLFISMQYVEGETLKAMIGGRPLALNRLIAIALQVAHALIAAHARGIIHRDIKSGNIKVTPQDQVKVLDFGLAKLLEREEPQDDHLTMTGEVMGTPSSMSPEQARGELVDHRSDIFSFGCVLYEMATGRTPFTGKTRIDVISALLKEAHTPAAELNPELPPLLSRVIDRSLHKDPAHRYQTMSDLVADLRTVVTEAEGMDQLFSSSGIPRANVQPPQQGISKAFWRGSGRRAAVFIGAAVLIAFVLALYRMRSPGPVAVAPIKTIAVLPFKPLVAHSRDETLELGMADTLIAKLSNIREIKVRPLSAVRKYVGLDQDALAAGREQRVDGIIDGHIQRAGEKVRVTVRLLRVGDEEQLWTGQFDEEMTDIFAVQDAITERVATALAVKLSAAEQENLTKRQTHSSEAYLLYLKGRYHLSRLTDDGFFKGRDYFQQAIDKDRSYARAYAGLAEAYSRLSSWNAIAPADGFPKAKEAVLKALELDDSSVEAHTQLANVQLFYYWDWSGSEREFKRAIEINPGNPDVHQAYSYYLSTIGKFDEALAEMKMAQELDPLSLEKLAGIADILYYQRRYDEAIEQYEKALEMDPNSGYVHWAIGNAYLQKGVYERAIATYKKSIPLSGDSADEPASLAYAYASAGKTREAKALLEELQVRSQQHYISPTLFAFIHSGLGEKNQAFAWLEKAYRGRDILLILIKVEPMFDRLRSDPRFADLVRRIRLPE